MEVKSIKTKGGIIVKGILEKKYDYLIKAKEGKQTKANGRIREKGVILETKEDKLIKANDGIKVKAK
jgi:hypothetical protein